MSYNMLKELICQGLSTRGIANKLNKSQSTIKYWLKKYKLKTNITLKQGTGQCEICKTQLKGKQISYCSEKCKNSSTNFIHQTYENQKQRSIKRKIKFIEKSGGKCSKCGYKKNLSALAFHHTDPNKKEIKLNARTLSNNNIDILLKELEKCILVCHNCHSELHNPHLNDLI